MILVWKPVVPAPYDPCGDSETPDKKKPRECEAIYS
jgi:hypothetical protein